MLRLATVILLLGCFCQLPAQNNIVDSLQQYIATSPLDTNRVILLNQLAYALREKDSELALNYARQAQMLAERLQYTSGIGYALENSSSIYLRKGILSYAFEVSMNALRINDSLHCKLLVARLLNTIAIINLKQNQHQPAIDNLKRACAVSREISDPSMLVISLNNLARAFLAQGKTSPALNTVYEGMEVNQHPENKNAAAYAFQLLGDIFLKTRNESKAVANYQRCLTEANLANNIYLKISTLYRFGNLYNMRGEPALAIPYLLESIELARSTEYGDELEASYQVLAESYKQANDLSKAYAYQHKYIELHDSIYRLRNNARLALMQAKFNTELKQAQIESLVQSSDTKQQEIDDQKVWLYFSIGSLAALLVLAVVLYYGYRKIKNSNRELKSKNSEIHEQARQLNNSNITKDKLFSIIGHDLRSPMASLKGLMSIMGNGVLSQEEFSIVVSKLKERLDSVYDDLDNLLQWAQSQLKGLQVLPEVFDLKSLVDSKIELFCETARCKKVTLINQVSDGSFVEADKNHMDLVVRNLLTNAIKFTSEGGLVIIQGSENETNLEISVSDSGVGIGMEDLNKLFNIQTHFTRRGTREEKGLGIGLLLTKEFVENNGGSIWVSSELGKGSTFTFTVKRHVTNDLVLDSVYELG